MKAEQASRLGGWTDGRARTRKEDKPHQGRGRGTGMRVLKVTCRQAGGWRSKTGSQQTLRTQNSLRLISIYANDQGGPKAAGSIAYFVSSSMRLVSTGVSFSGTEHRLGRGPKVSEEQVEASG